MNPLGHIPSYPRTNQPSLDVLQRIQQLQASGLGTPVGASDALVPQVQQMLLSILAPLLQGMMNGSSFGLSPGQGGLGQNPLGDLGLDPNLLGSGGGYGAPPSGGYGAPPSGGYGAPTPGGYGAGAPQGSGTGGQEFPTDGFGGVAGFFRDIDAGLAQGALNPQLSLPPGPGGYGSDGGYGTGGVGGDLPVGETIPTNLDYRDLNKQERRQISGMSDRERAVLHLWGIQMTSQGKQDGGVLHNVLQNPSQFQEAEVQLARELVARDQANFGGVTGKALDQEFFNLYQGMTGEDISGRYGNAPVNFSTGPIDMERRLTGQNGLSQFENEVLQLWGHSPLFNQGQIDGNIVDYALNSENTLEANLNRADLQALRQADLASDGVLNGDSLENSFLHTLDKLYLGREGASVERTMNDALQEAALRREGLLPPPEPGLGEIDPTQFNTDNATRHGNVANCPFLSGLAA